MNGEDDDYIWEQLIDEDSVSSVTKLKVGLKKNVPIHRKYILRA